MDDGRSLLVEEQHNISITICTHTRVGCISLFIMHMKKCIFVCLTCNSTIVSMHCAVCARAREKESQRENIPFRTGPVRDGLKRNPNEAN